MADRFILCKKMTEPTYKVPKSVQQAIPISKISRSGIFEIKEKSIYDKCYLIDDINYSAEDDTEQENIIYKYCSFLNSMKTKFKVIIVNQNKSAEQYEEELYYELTDEEFDDVKDGYNSLFKQHTKERNSIEQKKYLVVTANAKSYENAKGFFKNFEVTANSFFKDIGSCLTSLNAEERLESLHGIYRLGKESEFHFNFDEAVRLKRDWKNDICPSMYEVNDDYLKTDDKYHRVLFLKTYAEEIPDTFIKSITSETGTSGTYTTVTAIDVTPIPKEEVTRKLKGSNMSNEQAINKERSTRQSMKDFSMDISYARKQKRTIIKELMDANSKTDANMYYVSLTMIVSAATIEELNNRCDNIKTIAAADMMTIETHSLRQHEGFMTTLPVSGTYVRTSRTLETECLAALMPFNTTKLYEKQGIYLGVNQIDGSIIKADISKPPIKHGQIFGKTNGGKSMFVKSLITQLDINTDDYIIIIDPLHEYGDLARKLKGQEILLSSNTNNHINTLEIPQTVLNNCDERKSFITEKSDFMQGCIAKIVEDKFNILYINLIDKVLRNLYQDCFDSYDKNMKTTQPTWITFREYVKKENTPQAQFLYDALEIFVDGSFSIFAHESNVNINSRFLVWSQDNIPDNLLELAMLIQLEYIKRLASDNYKAGYSTYVFVDEEHRLMKRPSTADYLEKFTKEGRHEHLYYFGITQNVVDCLGTPQGQNILSNSEIVVMFKQSAKDKEKLASTFQLPEAPLGKYVDTAEPGTGLLKYGEKIIPLNNRIPEENRLYSLFQTD